MKHTKLFLTVALFACLLLSTSDATAQNKKSAKEIKEVTFLTNLDCENCAKKIQGQLPFEKGIKDMKVDVDKRTVWVQYQAEKTDTGKLQKAIEKIGYTAEVIEPEEAKESEKPKQ